MARYVTREILEEHRIITEGMDGLIHRAGIAAAMEDAATNITARDTGTVTGTSTTTSGTGSTSSMTGRDSQACTPPPKDTEGLRIHRRMVES